MSPPWVSGYQHSSRTISPLTVDRSENFSLAADLTACTAPGYDPLYAYNEVFESDDGGYTHSGTIDEWAWGTPAAWPDQCASGSKCWGTDLAGNYENNSNQTLVSPIIDLSAYSSPLTAKWWQAWYIESESSDQAYAQVSLNGGPWTTMWRHRGGTARVDWTQMTYDASVAAGGTIQFRFQLQSDITVKYSGYFVDDIRLLSDCIQQPGGLVVGNVYDDNTGVALVGAYVVNDAGQAAAALSTPYDLATDDGFYTLFSPAGSRVFTTTMPGGYQADVHSPTVLLSDTIRQNFFLPAASLSSAPEIFDVTLTLGTSTTVPLSLTNDGAAMGQFELKERDGGFIPPTGPSTDKVLLMGDNVDAAGWQDYRDALTAAGKTWDEWNLDLLSFPTASDLAPYDDLIWFVESIVAQNNAEAQIVADWLVSDDKGFFATSVDFLRSLQSGTPGQGRYNLYLLLNTPYLGNYAGSSITELQGISGDPVGGDFSPPNVISTSGTTKNNGDYADETAGAPTGLIYGPGNFGSGHAALTRHEGQNYRTVWLGVNFHNGLASQSQQNQLMKNIVDFLGARRDIPWLSLDLTSGTLNAGSERAIAVTFDANSPEVQEPGHYTATLVVENDSPYGPLLIPVTMKVVLDSGYGVQLSPNDAASGAADTTVTYTLRITNTGSMDDTYDLSVHDNFWPTHLSISSLTLASSSSSIFTVTVDIPVGTLGNDTDVVTITATSRGDNARNDSAVMKTSVIVTYGVDLSPGDSQTARPGETVTYTLHITNTGNVTDTFDLAVSGNVWTSTLSESSVVLASKASTAFTVAVDIPANTADNDNDSMTVTVTSRQDDTISDTVVLRTTSRSFPYNNYLPVAMSD